jgi:glycosyltransferase involved in cell wall biosynthesis
MTCVEKLVQTEFDQKSKGKGRKICVVLSVHPYNDGRVHFKEVRSAIAAGYKVDMVVANAPGDEPFEFGGARVIPVRRPAGRLGIPLGWFPLFRAALSTKADIYHIHDPDLLLVAWLLKIKTGRAAIHDVHEGNAQGFLVKSYLPKAVRHIAFALMWIWETVFSRLIRNVIVVEPNNLRRFERIGCKTCLVENLALRSQFPSAPSDPFRRPPNVLFVGTLSRERGCLLIPEIAAHLKLSNPEIKIVVTDRWFDEGARREMAEKITALGVADVVRFVPNVLLDQLPNYLADARIGLSLVEVTPVSRYQNFTKLFEYMAGGLAIVANDHPGKRPYFDACHPGVLTAYDSREIANAISSLMSDESRLRQFAANGRRAFLDQYNWEVAASRMLDLYDEISD